MTNLITRTRILFKVSAKLKAVEEEKNSLDNRLEIEMQSRRDMEGGSLWSHFLAGEIALLSNVNGTCGISSMNLSV